MSVLGSYGRIGPGTSPQAARSGHAKAVVAAVLARRPAGCMVAGDLNDREATVEWGSYGGRYRYYPRFPDFLVRFIRRDPGGLE